jgi:hypothetical protein
VYKTADYGKTWTSLSLGLPQVGYLHVVREDLENPDLLFVGSEFGLFLSFDGGKKWTAYRNDFPTIAVRDIQIHPRDRDLLVGTHGRGLWVLDDIKPLEALTPEVLASRAEMFDIRATKLYSYKSNSMYSGPMAFSGPNPRPGAMINYYLKEKPKSADNFKMAVYNKEGMLVSTLRPTRRAGLNRIYWNLRGQITTEAPEESGRRRFRRGSGSPFVLPGEYRVILELGDLRLEKPLTVKAFELHDFTDEERVLNQKFVREASEFNQRGSQLIRDMTKLNEQLEEVAGRVRSEKMSDKSLLDKLAAAKAKVEQIQKAYSYSVEGATGYRRPVMVALRGGTLPEQLSRLLGEVSRYQGAPTQTQLERFADIKKAVTPLLDAGTELKEKDVPEINRLLNGLNYPVIKYLP